MDRKKISRIPKNVFRYVGLNPKIYKDYFESKGIRYFRIGEFAISIDPQDENYYQIDLIK